MTFKSWIGERLPRPQVWQGIIEFLRLLLVEGVLLIGPLALFYVSVQMAYSLYLVGAIPFSPVEFVRFGIVSFAMMYGALAILGHNRFYSHKSTWAETISTELDGHYSLCCMIGRQASATLDGYRRRRKPAFALSDYMSTREKLEGDVFWTLIFVLVPIIGYFFSWSSYPIYQQFGQLLLIIGVILVFIVLYNSVFKRVQKYQHWRSFWIRCWEYVRDMNAPFSRLMDHRYPWSEIGVRSGWGDIPDEAYKDYVKEMLKLAQKIHQDLELRNMRTCSGLSEMELFVDQVIWFARMKRYTENLELPDLPELEEHRAILEDLKSLDELGTVDSFLYWFRSYRKLASYDLFEQWPEVMKEVQMVTSEATPEERRKILPIASDRLRSLRDLPRVPVLGSMKWIALLYGIVIAISPYIAPFIAMLLGFK